jgi:ribosome biogenesis GTPase
MDLTVLGWDTHFDQLYNSSNENNWLPARVAQEHKALYTLLGAEGEIQARVSGRFHHLAGTRAAFPSVGDWVLVGADAGGGDAVIQKVLPRRSCFSRKAVLAGGPTHGEGRTEEQVLAANIDTAFLVSGLDGDWNPRRIERFLSVTYDSGAAPVILLNKADVCDNVAARVSEAAELAMGVPVHAISAVALSGLEEVRGYITEGRTAVFLGSSGVGKSTIINSLFGEERLDTGGVRLHDSRGRHTTTRRELLLLPGGGLVIDTPGLRRIQLWGGETGLERTFPDIEQLMRECRFSDCSHVSEPGCAILAALACGELSGDRFKSFLKLQKELRNLAIRQDARMQRQTQRDRDKSYGRITKERKQLRKKGWL